MEVKGMLSAIKWNVFTCGLQVVGFKSTQEKKLNEKLISKMGAIIIFEDANNINYIALLHDHVITRAQTDILRKRKSEFSECQSQPSDY